MTVYNFNWFLQAMLRDNKEGDQDKEGIDIEEEKE